MEPLEQIQKCRGYYKRKARHTMLDGTETWALEHLDAHEEVERESAAIHPLDDMAYGHIEGRLKSRRKYTKSLYRHLFGDSPN